MTRYIKCAGLLLGLSMLMINTYGQAQTQEKHSNKVVEPKSNVGETENTFDEIIEIPFARRSKRELNYAISAITFDRLPVSGLSNSLTAINGRLSGLLMMNTGNKPGTGMQSLQVRGKSSYVQGSAPTILVDGVERGFTEIDQNEIESVTVLKDAAALNWYGLNAGNGAILITTKHGRAGQNYVDLTVQTGFQQVSKVVNTLNSYDYAVLYNRGLTNAGQAPVYTQSDLDAYRNHTDEYRFPDNDYAGRFLAKTAPTQRYSLAMGGGTEKIRYFTTVSYFNQEGLFKESKGPNYNSNFNYERFNFRINLDYDVTKTLSFTLLSGLRASTRNEPGNGSESVLSSLLTLPPNAFPITNEDGTYGGTSLYQTNPLGQLQAAGLNQTITNNLIASIQGKQNLDVFTQGLSLNVFFSYDAFGDYNKGFTENYAVTNAQISPAQTYRTPAVLGYRSGAFGINTKNTEFWGGFDYDRSFRSNHRIVAAVRAQQFISSAVDRIDYRGQMLAGRADYSFKNRYFLGFTGSYSGSSEYAPGRRFGFFPAVSAGWVVSDEAFLQDQQILSYLKVRASYGRTGNIGPTYDSSGNLVRLPYRTLYTRGAGPFLGSSFSTSTTAYAINPAGNPLTTWEKIDRANLGVDLTLWKNKLSLSADYFDERRKDILNNANMPGILGLTISSVNAGAASSRGIDLGSVYHQKVGQLTIDVNGNFSYASNRVDDQLLSSGTIAYQSPIGHTIGNVSASGTKRFYLSDGLFQSQAEIDASPKQLLSGTVLPGDIRYKDINGDNIIDGKDAIATDYTDIPKIYYGFGLNLSFGIFDFSAQFQGVQGRTIDIRSRVITGPSGLNELSAEAWTPENAATARFPRIALNNNDNNTANSDFWLRSGNFLKLRNVELGFTLPQQMATRLHLKKARLFIGGYNLLTLSGLGDLNIDPETPTAGTGSNYPFLKTYTLGLNVRF